MQSVIYVRSCLLVVSALYCLCPCGSTYEDIGLGLTMGAGTPFHGNLHESDDFHQFPFTSPTMTGMGGVMGT